MSGKLYDYAVFIGRFQPLHLGHEAIIRQAFEIANTPIIIVGSSTASRSLRNPFTFDERKEMIENAIERMFPGISDPPPEVNPYIILPIADSAYNFHDWLIRVKTLIKLEVKSGSKIALLGHYKDDTSYYLDYFPEYDFIPVDTMEGGLGATAVRNKLFSTPTTMRAWPTLPVSEPVQRYLKRWVETPVFETLSREYDFIQDYKKKWSLAPYPPTFVTTDAVVVALGHVLVIKRGRHPGKGQFALPGGFLDQGEQIEAGCLRELKEETKIDLPKNVLRGSIKSKCVFDHPLRDPRGRTITHAHLFELDIKSLPKVEAADDASEAMWISLSDLNSYEDKFFLDHLSIIRYFINRLA